jgi:purine-binding chemotaxis protein CheW
MTEQLLVVRVGTYLFGAPVSAVTEILAKPALTPIPKTPALIAGVAVVRGQPLAVLSVRPLLELTPADVTMALRWGGARGVTLVAVDHVESLWTPGAALPHEAWSGLVPSQVAPWITAAYRYDAQWLWAWAPDLPDRLQDTLTGGVLHVT